MEEIYTGCEKSQAVFLDSLLSLPKNPYCCDDFKNLKIRNRASAIKCEYLQLNQSLSRNYMILDIDHADAAWAYESANVPAPNFITINKKNGHGHAVYCLHAPVFADKPKAAAFFSDIQKKYVQILEADAAYSGFLTRNPYAHLIRDIHARKYTLSELDLDIKIKKIKNKNEEGFGRNCDIFHTVRVWAYNEIRKYRSSSASVWLDAVIAKCEEQNQNYEQALSKAEIFGIAKSIHRFTLRADSQKEANFRQTQAGRGRRGGIAKGAAYEPQREQAAMLKKQGLSISKISDILSISRMTIYRWNV